MTSQMHDAKTVEAACEVMHDAYEKAAVGAGWETNPASRKPWADVPEANKATMRAAVGALLDWLHSPADDEPTPSGKAEPTVDGWYTYNGGAEVMIFRLTRGQWYAAFDSGMMDRCEWGYIDQALGVWDIVPLVAADWTPLGEDVTTHSMLRSFMHADQRGCYFHSRLGKWVCGRPSEDGRTWVIDRECLRSHEGDGS